MEVCFLFTFFCHVDTSLKRPGRELMFVEQSTTWKVGVLHPDRLYLCSAVKMRIGEKGEGWREVDNVSIYKGKNWSGGSRSEMKMPLESHEKSEREREKEREREGREREREREEGGRGGGEDSSLKEGLTSPFRLNPAELQYFISWLNETHMQQTAAKNIYFVRCNSILGLSPFFPMALLQWHAEMFPWFLPRRPSKLQSHWSVDPNWPAPGEKEKTLSNKIWLQNT